MGVARNGTAIRSLAPGKRPPQKGLLNNWAGRADGCGRDGWRSEKETRGQWSYRPAATRVMNITLALVSIWVLGPIPLNCLMIRDRCGWSFRSPSGLPLLPHSSAAMGDLPNEFDVYSPSLCWLTHIILSRCHLPY